MHQRMNINQADEEQVDSSTNKYEDNCQIYDIFGACQEVSNEADTAVDNSYSYGEQLTRLMSTISFLARTSDAASMRSTDTVTSR